MSQKHNISCQINVAVQAEKHVQNVKRKGYSRLLGVGDPHIHLLVTVRNHKSSLFHLKGNLHSDNKLTVKC